MGRLFIATHLVIFCTIAHFAMSDALAKNLHVRTAKPVVLKKDGYVIYDSKMEAAKTILMIYGGAE